MAIVSNQLERVPDLRVTGCFPHSKGLPSIPKLEEEEGDRRYQCESHKRDFDPGIRRDMSEGVQDQEEELRECGCQGRRQVAEGSDTQQVDKKLMKD